MTRTLLGKKSLSLTEVCGSSRCIAHFAANAQPRIELLQRDNYCAGCYPWITEAARKFQQKPFVIDGEAVILGVDGISDFNSLHSAKHDEED
jgi:ATP-dependent DNA ligase